VGTDDVGDGTDAGEVVEGNIIDSTADVAACKLADDVDTAGFCGIGTNAHV